MDRLPLESPITILLSSGSRANAEISFGVRLRNILSTSPDKAFHTLTLPPTGVKKTKESYR